MEEKNTLIEEHETERTIPFIRVKKGSFAWLVALYQKLSFLTI